MSTNDLRSIIAAHNAPRPVTVTVSDPVDAFPAPTARRVAPGNPMTDKQSEFVRKLLAEREGVEAAQAVRGILNEAREAGKLDTKVASKAITALLAIPKATVAAPAPVQGELLPQAPQAAQSRFAALPDVPAGHYAVDNEEGVLRFYTVERPTEGRWHGYTFVKVHASNERFSIKGRAAHVILTKIAADPKAASIRFGHETNHCGVCGRELTDEVSRAAGIGPICAKNRKW